MTKRRTLSTAFKKKVSLAALRGDRSLQDLAAHYQPQQYLLSIAKVAD